MKLMAIVKALRIYHRLDQYFKREDMVNDYKPRYLVYVGYSNILGLSGKYDESIAICKREIEFLREKGILNYLYNFYYNIGWNISKKIECGLEKKNGYGMHGVMSGWHITCVDRIRK